jgi:DNA-binding beta-propeller fold protein YncE
MKRNLVIAGIFVSILGASLQLEKRSVVEAAAVQAPRFEVDPLWPKPLPNHWVMGSTVGVSVDSQDHVWIVHRGNNDLGELRSSTNPPQAECCSSAPFVLEFDQAGNLLRHWGGPGEGYDWPQDMHGVTVDYKGNVWLGSSGLGTVPPAARGSGPPARVTPQKGQSDLTAALHDEMILKFTRDGKFLLQIGKPGQSKGSNDPENVRRAAKTFVDPKTDELYVADGYGNHRVIVFDAETGKYKRHWGAYGNKPEDKYLGDYNPDAPPAQQFGSPVHCADLSNDNLLYVCDRINDRIQVFKPDGTFVKEAFVAKRTLAQGSVWDIAFSRDPAQKYLYVADGANEKIRILERDTLQVLTSFGDGGRQPGQFYEVHNLATDSKGNLYTTETTQGHRLQKFVYKGLSPVTKEDQGVVWPRTNAR